MVIRRSRGKGSRWEVPRNLHEPIEQDAILLTQGRITRRQKRAHGVHRWSASQADHRTVWV